MGGDRLKKCIHLKSFFLPPIDQKPWMHISGDVVGNSQHGIMEIQTKMVKRSLFIGMKLQVTGGEGQKKGKGQA